MSQVQQMSSHYTSILIVEDHPIVQMGLTQLIAAHWPQAQVDCAGTMEQTQKCLEQSTYDIALLDLHLPDASGLESLNALQRQAPGLPVLVLSMSAEGVYAQRAFQLGAAGYLSKDRAPSELITAMEHIARTGRYITASEAHRMVDFLTGNSLGLPHESLSAQEYRVLVLLAQGRRIKEIGDAMHLSPKTITTYRARILDKLGAANNADLVQYCLKHALVSS